MIKNIIHSTLKIFKKKLIDISSRERREFLDKLVSIKSGYKLIRIGPKDDGGYIIPDDLSEISSCFSPGTGNLMEFEKDLYFKYNIKSYMCDGTIDKLINLPEGLEFINKNLSVNEDSNSITLKKWIDEKNVASDSILQMDIEGSEYSIILDLDQNYLKRFRIILIEFHNLDLILNDQFFLIFKDTFNKLLNDFSIVNISPNNCCGEFIFEDLKIPRVIEFSFLRNDRLNNKISEKSINKIYQNVKNKKTINFNDFKR
jgi:hypothetical protein